MDRPETTINDVGAGACIGEMAVLDSSPRSASVRALERTRALRVPGEGFKRLLSERPEMSEAIVAELVHRMRGLMAQTAGSAPDADEPDDAGCTTGTRPLRTFGDMKRDTTQTIWRTVVFAGAMLGTPACKAKPAATTPTPPSNAAPAADPTTPQATAKPDPTAGRSRRSVQRAAIAPTRTRGADDDGGGGAGRGFVLS